MKADHLGSQSKLTIVSANESFEDYPFLALSSMLRQQVEAAYESLPKSYKGIQSVQPTSPRI